MIFLIYEICIQTLGLYWDTMSHTMLYNICSVLQGGTLDTDTVIEK